jgi:hypothetical protein
MYDYDLFHYKILFVWLHVGISVMAIKKKINLFLYFGEFSALSC